MPDYTSILRRSISALPDPSPELREAVYQRARAALARQLTAVDPPLSAREIEAQHRELEDAVTRLEADFVPQETAEPEQADTRGDESFYDVEPQRDAAPSAKAVATPPADRYEDEVDADYDGEDDADEIEEEDEEEERASRGPLIALLAVVLAVVALAAFGYAERETIFAMFGSGGEETVTVIPPPTSSEPVDSEPTQVAATPRADKRPDRLANGSDQPPEELPLPNETAMVEPTTAPEATGGVETSADATGEAATPEAGVAMETEAPEPPSSGPEALATLPPQQPAPENPLENGAAPTEEQPADSTAALAPQQTAALEAPQQQSIVAQRAIYYLQGAEGSPGRAVEGSVNWVQVSRDNGPAIQATLRLAEQNVTTTVTISRNTDSTLPASHLVEVQFSGELGSSPIQRVPALVLKQTEQAKGQPLAGAAVPVTNDLFWIALSNEQDQIARNLQLLREGSWFDIPILFNDGTRALLTFEKGIPGDKVFETVLASWTPA
jgi:hypothetical protein